MTKSLDPMGVSLKSKNCFVFSLFCSDYTYS
uniref:Uncharacterized protein n=1 Tax=Anguilla anguilla TaxID=7936 RepID=A0A0E9XPI4_ANGAN